MYCLAYLGILNNLLLILNSAFGQTSVTFLWRKTDSYFVSEDSRLYGNKLYEQNNVHTLMQCGMKCHRHPDCLSYNYNWELGHCELNSQIDQSHPDDLRQFIGYIYVRKGSYSIDEEALGPCVEQPCGENGRCLERQSTKGILTHKCLCNEGWTGETCNDTVIHKWTAWSDWGECSVSCDKGWQKRTRQCTTASGNIVSTMNCHGRGQEERQCPGLLPCPRWSQWGIWSICSTANTCGLGNKYRSRTCMYGGQSGVDRLCMGEISESTPCVEPGCEAPIKLHGGSDSAEGALLIYNDLIQSWGVVCADSWNKMDGDLACRTMGYTDGMFDNVVPKFQHDGKPYMLSGVNCTGSEQSIQACQHETWENSKNCDSGAVSLQCIVAGGWNTWSSWGDCSVTCAEGIRLRNRLCNYPAPARGGANCSGEQQQSKVCILDPCPVDGTWHPWTDWDLCNVTCGGGDQLRQRDCNQPKHGGQTCLGESVQRQECNTHPCPIDCVWEQWSNWTMCNLSCGGGWQQRNRGLDGPYHGGKECQGDAEQRRMCNTHECPIDCVWNVWQAWQPCNVTCGGGSKMRLRVSDDAKYGGKPCNGSNEDWEQCNTHPCPIDCVWDIWSEWHHCNRSCGGGWQMRYRNKTDALYGGLACPGDTSEIQTCNTHNCPVDCVWNTWGEWNDCNTTCGGGWQQRYRTKEGPQHDGKECIGSPDDKQTCNTHHCPVDGYWAEWMAWSECSLTCSEGTQTRNRTCVAPKYGGKICTGISTEQQTCYITNCPEDGFWAEWGVWSKCSKTCGRGNHYRTRYCETPLFGGRECVGDDRQTTSCIDRPCPEDGYWQSWSEWCDCPVSCGGGLTNRNRTCVPPLSGGVDCEGNGTEEMECNTQHCPVNGYWKEWTSWEDCNVTCGGGTQGRQRTCQQPLYGGDACQGDSNQWQSCNDNPCPVDCYWENWTNWTECNRTCGGGYQSRQRTAVGPYQDGQPCVGEAIVAKLCNIDSCAVDCIWLEWGPWGKCNETCGGGKQHRSRSKDGPQFGGLDCAGSSDYWMDCNTHPCPIDCTWQSWTEWDQCNTTCGGGWSGRTRLKYEEKYKGLPCEGAGEEFKECNTHNCPIDCVWNDWSVWADCSLSCGVGRQNRTRTMMGPFYGGAMCNGSKEQWQDCNTHNCPIDCVWEPWSQWATCDVTCGGGTQQRNRQVNGPHYGGLNCTGNYTEVQQCNNNPCPIDCVWNEWNLWQTCNITCGGGLQIRNRSMSGPFYGGSSCNDSDLDQRSCNTHNCPIDCIWGTWQSWQACSVTCGGGEKKRERSHKGPYYGGNNCIGSAEEFATCNSHHCPVNGYWNEWSIWSECTTSCGGGTSNRSRICVPPLYGGDDCKGLYDEQKQCNTQPCPVPGDWLEWSEWGICSATCDGGTRVRTRQCNMTSYGDLTIACLGNDTSIGVCHQYSCQPYAKNCDELIERGFVDKNWVQIDPDGDFGFSAFFAFCQGTGPNMGDTTVYHQYDSPVVVQGFEGAGEFQAELIYQDQHGVPIPLDQLMALVDMSESCKQFIRWDCKAAVINPSPETLGEKKPPYKLTYWSNRWQEGMYYWGNTSPDVNKLYMTCECGVHKTCNNTENLCNCDSNDDVWRYDEGWLTFKPDLPVTYFRAGDTGEEMNEKGKFTVGPLICNGTASSSSSYDYSYYK